MRPRWHREWPRAIVCANLCHEWHPEWCNAIRRTSLAVNAHRNARAPFGAHPDLGMARPMLGHHGWGSACTGGVRCT